MLTKVKSALGCGITLSNWEKDADDDIGDFRAMLPQEATANISAAGTPEAQIIEHPVDININNETSHFGDHNSAIAGVHEHHQQQRTGCKKFMDLISDATEGNFRDDDGDNVDVVTFFSTTRKFLKNIWVGAIDFIKKLRKSELSSRFLSRSKFENSLATFWRMWPIVPGFISKSFTNRTFPGTSVEIHSKVAGSILTDLWLLI